MKKLHRDFSTEVELSEVFSGFSEILFPILGKVPEEQVKAEEMQMFSELYHQWKGTDNNHHLKLPRLYDKVIFKC